MIQRHCWPIAALLVADSGFPVLRRTDAFVDLEQVDSVRLDYENAVLPREVLLPGRSVQIAVHQARAPSGQPHLEQTCLAAVVAAGQTVVAAVQTAATVEVQTVVAVDRVDSSGAVAEHLNLQSLAARLVLDASA